jgi:spermidine synthase
MQQLRRRQRICFTDRLKSGETRTVVGSIEYSGQTKIQQIQVLKTRQFGKMLILGNEIQLAERDQRIYHRYLVKPGLEALKRCLERPIRSLVLGGADGYSLDLLTRDACVGTITLVDHDSELVELFATGPLGQMFKTSDAFADKRVSIQFHDVYDYLRRLSKPAFDFVIFDLTDDWWESNHAAKALKILASRSRDDLVISLNAGTGGNSIERITRSGLEIVGVWSIPIPSFGEPWWCVLATLKGSSFLRQLGHHWLIEQYGKNRFQVRVAGK